jgi:hypothetical protein
MPTSLSKDHRKLLANVTAAARVLAESACRAALENLAVHEKEYRSHMNAGQRALRNRLRERGRAIGDVRDRRTNSQEIRHLYELAAYEHWHRLLFTRFLTENHLLITDEANGAVPVTLEECEELAPELGARDGLDLACRFASLTLPGVFRRDDPVLDLPIAVNDQVEMRKLLASLPKECFLADDALGWTYQFWQAQRKDEVNDSGKKIGADELAPVTQLFTEDYMVEFLLHNTLGAWWSGKLGPIKAASEDVARAHAALSGKAGVPPVSWTYLRFVQDETTKTWRPAAGTFDQWPKAARLIRLLDPCMGSGHFLVFALPLVVRLRMEEEKISAQEAVAQAIRDNIFGLELDERCTQIAAFNIALAAWKLAGYQQLPPMHLACSGLAPHTTENEWVALAGGNDRLQRGIARLYALFKDAPVLGSLINPRAMGGDLVEAEFYELQPLLEQALAQETKDDSAHEIAVTAHGLAKAAEILAGKFILVATNVPYLGRGKQNDVLKDYCDNFHPEAIADLATCFIERCLDFCAAGASTAIVAPQSLLFQNDYIDVRKTQLSKNSWNIVARLGEKGFESPQAAGAFTVLLELTRKEPSDLQAFMCIDVATERNPNDKASALLNGPVSLVGQATQLKNPDARITGDSIVSKYQLAQFADVTEGLSTGDGDRFTREFWELNVLGGGWATLQGAPTGEFAGDGRSTIVFWENGEGVLKHFEGARVRGHTAWGRAGIIVGRIRNLRCDIYDRSLFEKSCVVITPHDVSHLAPIRTFTESKQFEFEVKRLDQNLRASGGAFSSIPFDLPHWQNAAAKKYPHGLPKPLSSDPTQWLFNGHPKGSDHPLHVAVARLLGYRWPRQTGSSFPDCPALGSDGLEKLTDDEGIVCLPPLNRNQPAAVRLRQLLTTALDTFDERALIAAAGLKGSKSKTLEDWLRDEFFEQHAKLFYGRAFIWHLWDGCPDGFHALVNYHKLDHATLQKLTYSHLGDWIRQQDEDAKADKPGAAVRLGAARALQIKLAAILEGEAPLDIFVRWKSVNEQAQGWHPDLNDGVRQNIRPFLLAGDVGKKGAGVFRTVPLDLKDKDRGSEPQRAKKDYPWFWCEKEPGIDPVGGREFVGTRWNNVHLTLARKRQAKP